MLDSPIGPTGFAAEGRPLQFHLSPLTTGQVLDRTFVLYRLRFSLFAWLAVIPATVALLFGLLQVSYLLVTHTPLSAQGLQAFSGAYFVSQGINLLGGLARLCVYGISIAATTWCISRIYLGEAATMELGFNFAFRHWFRYIVMVLAQAWFAFWLPFLVGTVAIGATFALPGMRNDHSFLFVLLAFLEITGLIVWLIINFIRVSLAIPACVVEGLPIRASIHRSRTLLASRKYRVFLLFLFLGALSMVFSIVLVPVTLVFARQGSSGLLVVQLVALTSGFVSSVLLSPIAAIALCLFYFDERVRREGFDIELLMRRAQPVEESVVEAEATPVAEVGSESLLGREPVQ